MYRDLAHCEQGTTESVCVPCWVCLGSALTLQFVGILRDGTNQGVIGRDEHEAALGNLRECEGVVCVKSSTQGG